MKICGWSQKDTERAIQGSKEPIFGERRSSGILRDAEKMDARMCAIKKPFPCTHMGLYEEEEHALINTLRSGFLLSKWMERQRPAGEKDSYCLSALRGLPAPPLPRLQENNLKKNGFQAVKMESNARLRQAGGASDASPDLFDSSAGGGVLQGHAPAPPADARPPPKASRSPSVFLWD